MAFAHRDNHTTLSLRRWLPKDAELGGLELPDPHEAAERVRYFLTTPRAVISSPRWLGSTGHPSPDFEQLHSRSVDNLRRRKGALSEVRPNKLVSRCPPELVKHPLDEDSQSR